MRSMNNGNGQSSWQGPQPVRQDWETALARTAATTFWELV